MDPISVISAVITVATFVKDVVELGQQIRASVSKVTGNNKRLKALTDELVHTLNDLENLCHGREDIDQSPELRHAINRLKADMFQVHRICQKMIPVDDGGQLSVVKAKVKAWHKRDDVQNQIQRLNEHVMACYTKFTAFTAARTESISARTEHAVIVHGHENHIRLARLEVLVTRMLLDTQFGRQIIERVGTFVYEGMNSFQSVESQYFNFQLQEVMVSLEDLALNRKAPPEVPDERHPLPFLHSYLCSESHEDVVVRVLKIRRQLQDHPDHDRLSIQNGAQDLKSVSDLAGDLGMLVEAAVTATWVAKLYRTLVAGDAPTFLPYLGMALVSVSITQREIGHRDLAHSASHDALNSLRMTCDLHRSLDFRGALGKTLLTHASSLRDAERVDESLSILQEAVSLYRPLLTEVIRFPLWTPGNSVPQWAPRDDGAKTIIIDGIHALVDYSRCLMSRGHYAEAFDGAKEALGIHHQLPSSHRMYATQGQRYIFDIICDTLSSMYKVQHLAVSALEDIVALYSIAARDDPQLFSDSFLRILSSMVVVCHLHPNEDVVRGDPKCLFDRCICVSRDGHLDALDGVEFPARVRTIDSDDDRSIASDAAFAFFAASKLYMDRKVVALMICLFKAHPEQGITGLKEAADRLCIDLSFIDWRAIHTFLRRVAAILDGMPTKELQLRMADIAGSVMEHVNVSGPNARRSKQVDLELALALRFHSLILAGCQLYTDAVEAVDCAIALFRTHELDNYRKVDYATTLRSRSSHCAALGNAAQAVYDIRESANIWREMVDNDPLHIQASILTDVLGELVERLSETGIGLQEADAVKAERDSFLEARRLRFSFGHSYLSNSNQDWHFLMTSEFPLPLSLDTSYQPPNDINETDLADGGISLNAVSSGKDSGSSCNNHTDSSSSPAEDVFTSSLPHIENESQTPPASTSSLQESSSIGLPSSWQASPGCEESANISTPPTQTNSFYRHAELSPTAFPSLDHDLPIDETAYASPPITRTNGSSKDRRTGRTVRIILRKGLVVVIQVIMLLCTIIVFWNQILSQSPWGFEVHFGFSAR